MLPTFLGIGAPKAGTTMLANALAAHPEICFARMKEPDFFSYGFDPDRIDEYESLFECDSETRAVGEFSTGYLAWPGVPENIAQVIPKARFLVVLRDPVAQIYSHYWHLQRQNFHTQNPTNGQISFEDALDHFEERLVRPAYYADHLERWFRLFDRDQFYITLFDDVKADRNRVLREVLMFVGVSEHVTAAVRKAAEERSRGGTSPRSSRAARIGSTLYDRLNRAVYVPLKKAIGVSRADRLKEMLRVRQLLERTFRKSGYPPMSQKTRTRLAERFREPNARLGEMIGRDLSHWGDNVPG